MISWQCFCEHVGVKAPGTAKRTAFLPFVRSETVMVWTSPAGSRYEKVDSGSLSPTEMVAEILDEVENRRGFGLKRLSLRGRVKLEERVLVLGDKSDVVVEEERSLEKERDVSIDENFELLKEHPFFGDPLKGNSSLPAEEEVDCYSKTFLLGFGTGSAAVI
ncbi:unnamed protein product [Trifolium pratense]|uniref:Uncharacterized protein n=1 Tax=Trifolium pratense TaxID=57577 RepID=A0ACB0JS78_TRIPR|nr:unnamed protein product [Trifolium pratense]